MCGVVACVYNSVDGRTANMNIYRGPNSAVITALDLEDLLFERAGYLAEPDSYEVTAPYQLETVYGPQWAFQVVYIYALRTVQ